MDDSPEKLKPLVSILMLTYNRARYLPAAIESVLTQTYPHWELIIIDDGSTDETPAIIATYPDPRIHYIRHKENAGLFDRRHESLQYVSGTYTAVLDSDDYWSSRMKLDTQVTFLETHKEHVLVGTFTTLVDTTNNKIGSDSFQTEDSSIRKRILARNQFTHSSVLMRTDALLKTGGYRPTLAEDLDLFLQLGNYGKLANIPEFMTAYRIHESGTNDRGIQMAQAILSIVRRHAHNYPNLCVALFKSYVRVIKAIMHSYEKKSFL